LQSNLLAQGKFCILVEGSYSAVKGGFTGETALIGSDVGFLVPKLEGNWGYGISLGSMTNNLYGGVKYARVEYDATFLGIPLGKAKHNLIGMEMKVYFPSERKDGSLKKPVIQAFALLGMEYGNLKVENAYVNSSSVSLGEANFTWLGFPIGAGIAINPVKAFSINFGVAYRLATVMGAKEAGSSEEPWELEDPLGIGGLVCDIGLLIQF
jgi:opacity protein-like surface antigen